MSVAILSLVIVIPVAAAIVWQRYSRALWGSLFFGLGAFAVVGLLRIPLGQMLTSQPVAELLNFYPILVLGVPFVWILFSLIYALLREGVRWLILCFPASSVRTWKEGVMFGLGYSCLASLQHLGEIVAHHFEEIELNRYSLVETVELLNSLFPPIIVSLVTLDWGVGETAFNVGTCLIVMFSVRRRNVWLLLAAILWYVVYSQAERIVLFNIPPLEHWQPYERHVLKIVSPLLTGTLVGLLPFTLLLLLRKVGRFT